jgi:hypothetical protein
MSSNLIYFYCFRQQRDDTKSFFERHHCGKAVTIILSIFGMICLCVFGAGVLFPTIGIVGEHIASIQLTDSVWMEHLVYGIWFIVIYFLNLFQTFGILIPIGALIILRAGDQTKIVCIIILAFGCIYIPNLIGVISASTIPPMKFFKATTSSNPCNFTTYANVMGESCWVAGNIVDWIIIGMYVIVGIIGVIVYHIRKCIEEARQARDRETTPYIPISGEILVDVV